MKTRARNREDNGLRIGNKRLRRSFTKRREFQNLLMRREMSNHPIKMNFRMS
jgi:hypothetical protein